MKVSSNDGAVSRVLLASSVTGAVWVATVVGLATFGLVVLVSQRPQMPRSAMRSMLFIGVLVVLVLGIVAATNGESEVHQKDGFHQKGGGAHHDYVAPAHGVDTTPGSGETVAALLAGHVPSRRPCLFGRLLLPHGRRVCDHQLGSAVTGRS